MRHIPIQSIWVFWCNNNFWNAFVLSVMEFSRNFLFQPNKHGIRIAVIAYFKKCLNWCREWLPNLHKPYEIVSISFVEVRWKYEFLIFSKFHQILIRLRTNQWVCSPQTKNFHYHYINIWGHLIKRIQSLRSWIITNEAQSKSLKDWAQIYRPFKK